MTPTASGRPSPEYARVFSATTAGVALLVTGIIGLDIRYMRGFFQGAKWVEAPVWWQIAAGIALLLLSAYWIRQLAGPRLSATPAAPRIKNVGAGKSAGAERRQDSRSLE